MNANDTIRIRVDIPDQSKEVTLKVETNLIPSKLFDLIFDEVVKQNILEEKYRRYFKKLNYYTDINNIITAKEIFRDDYSIADEEISINSLGIRDIKYFSMILTKTNEESNSALSLLCLSGKETVNKKFSIDAPNWRLVGLGLNLEGICDNEHCKAFDQKVINVANKGTGSEGYGKINIILYINDEQFLCPNCKQYIFAVTNFYFRNCAFEWTGVTRKSKGGRETLRREGIAPKDVDVLTFKFEGDLEKEKKDFYKYEFNITKLDS